MWRGRAVTGRHLPTLTEDLVLGDLGRVTAPPSLRTWRREELSRQVDDLSALMRRAGLRPGDTVLGLDLEPTQAVIGYLAAAAADLRWLLADGRRLEQGSAQVRHASPRGVVVSTPGERGVVNSVSVADLASLLPTVMVIVTMEGDDACRPEVARCWDDPSPVYSGPCPSRSRVAHSDRV